MKKVRFPIKWKITSMTLGVIFISLLIGMTVFLGLLISNNREEIGQRTMLTAQLVGQMEKVQQMSENDSGYNELQALTERIRSIQGDDYIIILNMEGIKLTHPISERIGTIFEGGDESAAFHEHVYLSEAQTGNGQTIRAFVPILNEEKEQVGVVVVGNQLPSWWLMVQEVTNPFLFFIGFAMTFGVWGSWQLAKHIKNQTFQMEPDDLARTLKEKTATFHAINEGIIAIDQEQRITIMNEAAKRMLNINLDAIGKEIQKVIPDTRLPEVLKLNEPLLEREFYVQGRAIFSNRIPIVQEGETIGVVAIFQDKTELTRLAKQLTGVQNYVDALRVQNHEYSNKLHTIAGLIELGEGKKALDYIFKLSEENDQQSSLVKQIGSESIAGLLLGKIRRGKEMGIVIKIQEDSNFDRFPEGIDEHDLVVIIGNLLNNSMESFQELYQEHHQIHFGLYQNHKELQVQVSDNGIGISESDMSHLFEKGYSTKSDERGIGLYLIKTITERIGGDVEVYSNLKDGTEMVVRIPMLRKQGEYENERKTLS